MTYIKYYIKHYISLYVNNLINIGFVNNINYKWLINFI